MGYLTAEGYLPSIDDDGDIKFKVEGETYYTVKNTRIFILQKFLNNSNGCSDILYKTLNTANRRFRNITIYSLNVIVLVWLLSQLVGLKMKTILRIFLK